MHSTNTPLFNGFNGINSSPRKLSIRLKSDFSLKNSLFRYYFSPRNISFAKQIQILMVVSFLASGNIGVASCPPLCSFRPLEQPPLSAASPRELIYNAHLGNTKGLLSSSRFNAFSPQAAALSFLHVISSPPSFPLMSFSLFSFALRAPFFRPVISRYSPAFYSFFVIFLPR